MERGMRILVVDDEIHLVKSLKSGLKLEGYKVIEACNAAEALKRLDGEEKIDLVLTDYAMPDMDGLALLHEIKKRDAEIPVILMSVYTNKELRMDAFQLNCARFLEKPFSLDELLSAIENSTTAGRGDRFEMSIASKDRFQAVDSSKARRLPPLRRDNHNPF